MSKATFYEHFANKEECIIALFDRAVGFVLGAMAEAAASAGEDPAARMAAGTRAFLGALDAHQSEAQTLLVEIIGAGPRAARRRDQVLQAFAAALDAENEAAARRGGFPRFASPHDSFALVGAIAELASRQIRLGEPPDVLELEPVIDRLLLGVLRAPAR
jgi:AcrR family transcriptional regulator